MRLSQLVLILLLSTVCLAQSALAKPPKVGFIYVGPVDDYGYNMSMDLGRQYLEQKIPGLETTYFENVPESAEVLRVMERLARSDHSIIFATSYGYLDYAIQLGKKYPEVTFLHAGGLKTSDNVGTYWADSDEGMYLAGITAGSVSKTGKLGFVGAFQIPQLLRSINAFTLGAQSVNPEATVTVVWTGGWWEPQKEAEAVNAFASANIDVIAEQVDSPITIAQTAEKLGIHVVGKDVDIHSRAPNAWLTGVSWNWGPMMLEEVQQVMDGSWEASHVRGDLASGATVLDPFGKTVAKEDQKKVLAAKEQILDGKKNIWAGPIYRQDGELLVDESSVMDTETVETTDFFVKGVIGAPK